MRILEAALVFAAKEHRGAIPDRVQSAVLELGKWLFFGKEEIVAVYETVMESMLANQEKGE